jgi:hypothetical protein
MLRWGLFNSSVIVCAAVPLLLSLSAYFLPLICTFAAFLHVCLLCSRRRQRPQVHSPRADLKPLRPSPLKSDAAAADAADADEAGRGAIGDRRANEDLTVRTVIEVLESRAFV